MSTPITNKPYNIIQKNIAEILVANAEDTMKEAADMEILYVLEDNPDESTEITSSGDIIGRIAVGVDSTWQKKRPFLKNWCCNCHVRRYRRSYRLQSKNCTLQGVCFTPK